MEIRTVDGFLKYWHRIHERTSRIISCIPPEHLEWTWREGKFTLGDLVRHLAALERYMFAENVSGRPSRYPGHGRDLADGYEQVMAFYDRLHRETIGIFRGLTDEQLFEDCWTPGGARLKVWKWLRAMIEHEVHHRGQIYTYLAMLDVSTPPLYGLTAEEVQERSDG